jgi:hypothetical protein
MDTEFSSARMRIREGVIIFKDLKRLKEGDFLQVFGGINGEAFVVANLYVNGKVVF